jgi:DNA-directed RNA polymerase III subunit RPC3
VAALENLFNDSSLQFLKKVSFDHKLQAPIYSVNWQGLFTQFQEQMIYKMIEATLSKYHTRVLRILKQKGFLEEKDIIQFCLMSVKDTRALINRLLSDGFVQVQELQVKQHGTLHLYGLNQNTLKIKLTQRVAKACLNVLIREEE